MNGNYLFYGRSDPEWRAHYLRIDAYTRLGVGMADIDQCQRWVVFAFGR
jgi:hypothetical protein